MEWIVYCSTLDIGEGNRILFELGLLLWTGLNSSLERTERGVGMGSDLNKAEHIT